MSIGEYCIGESNKKDDRRYTYLDRNTRHKNKSMENIENIHQEQVGGTTNPAAEYGTKTASGNARIFNCKQCNRAFTREEHLTRHTLLTHNKLKPFVCGICSRPFSRRDLLLRHAKNLHQGSELAVSRIRKLYKRSSKEDDDSDDSHEQPPTSIKSSTPKSESAINESQSPVIKSIDDNKDYESPEKKKLKMSVNMLVS